MIAAIDTRCSSMPQIDMPISVAIIVSGTIAPTMIPVRRPSASINTISTTRTVWPRLSLASSTEAWTRSGWKIAMSRSIPSGRSPLRRATDSRTCTPSSTTFDFSTIEMPSTIAGLILERAGAFGGSW